MRIEDFKTIGHLFNLKLSLNPSLFFTLGLEKAERYWWPKEANECLHVVAQLQS